MDAVLADLKEWLQDRKQHLDLFDETKTARLDNPLYTLGGLVWLSWMIVIVSGVILMLWYIPTTTGAYQSIMHITYDIPLGWLARGMHKYGADMLITCITLRIYRMYFAGEYKKPGELSWMILFASLVLGMISGITGYLLIWNQRAFWAAKTVLTVPTYYDEIPLVKNTGLGHAIAYIFLGGPAVAQAAITRFYAIHLGISVLLVILAEVFFYRTRRRRLNLSLFTVALVIVFMTWLSFDRLTEMGRWANPNRTPLPILSDWYFLALYQLVKYMPPLWAGIAPALLIGYGMAVPFLDRTKETRALERPFFFVVGLLALAYFIGFTVLIMLNIAVISRDPPVIFAVTVVVLTLAFIWEMAHRRRKRLAAQQAKPAPPGRPAPGAAPAG
ncbi:MAG: cytochrome bc complex cytochrome b subunit [Bacillati bacterium ANGP1]|uniref:Cytochrome bc complex cytochrome b subunit n=1 Tax=Candidatus Segetimicrobium genomatis TaxID=2569760 RepID=A0A537K1E7_9BACT|nr:MAG: cytochrome bc complex cytochrome b subunit [Terrabacteria group bacterium ANGP1]